MKTWTRLWLAERLKFRRTLALYLCLIGPLVTAALSGLSLANLQGLAGAKGVSLWEAFAQYGLSLWAGLLLPIVVCLQVAQGAQLEHANHKWKQLLSLPLDRKAVYAGKLGWLASLALLSNAIMGAMLLVIAFAAGLAHVADGSLLATAVYLLRQLTLLTCAGMLMFAVQFALSMRLPSFAAVLTVGFVGTVVGMMGGGVAPQLMSFFPWSMPVLAVNGKGASATMIAATSLAGAAMVLAWDARNFDRRQFAD